MAFPTRRRGWTRRLLRPVPVATVVTVLTVSLVAVMAGVPAAMADGGSSSLWQSLTSATRRDGTPTPVKKPASSLSGLVLPTSTPAPGPTASPTSSPDPSSKSTSSGGAGGAAGAVTAGGSGSSTTSSTPTPSASASPTPTPSATSSASSGYPFTSASVWRTSVASAPLDPNSAAMIPTLTNTIVDRYGGVAAFNVWDYNSTYYVADSSTPRVDVLFNDCQNKGYLPAGLTGSGGQFTQIPVPTNAVAATGTDAAYSVYSPATDQLWELWQFRKNSSNQWTACWGGRIDNVSTSTGAFTNGFGASASGLAQSGGLISLAEARSLTINHAMDLAIPDPASWNTFRWPATRSDGNTTTPNAIPEGSRLRLDPSVNVASLNLTPIAAAIARAAQTYGFIVTDKAGAVSVVTESGLPVQASTGANPWTAILGSTPSYSVMANFPWDRLQVVAADYGRH